MSKKVKKHLLLWHIGLGDAFMCHGLVRTLVERYGDITLPILPDYEASIKWMFKDDPRIEFFVLPEWNKLVNDLELKKEHLAKYLNFKDWNVTEIGFFNEKNRLFDGTKATIDQRFYAQADVPFENKYNKVKILRASNQIEVPKGKYAFVHWDKTRGMTFDLDLMDKRLKVVQSTDYKRENIFEYVDLIRGAAEIHVADSSFANLIELVGAPGKKWVYDTKHLRVRTQGFPTYLRDWTIVDVKGNHFTQIPKRK